MQWEKKENFDYIEKEFLDQVTCIDIFTAIPVIGFGIWSMRWRCS